MCENVNINVSETNETINIVATEVQEVIDINVFETAEDVTLNITEQLIQVNVNKVTAAEQIQSDWAQTDNEALDFIKNKPTIPTNTSDLINDGEDGVNPFITANDIPPVTGFVPYTGATEDVNLGEFGLLTGNVEFDNTPTNIPTTAGAMYWNDADGTADLILKGGNVKLQVGQESVIRVVNKTATNINLLEANYQAVRVTGAQGQRLKVDLAQATNDNLSAETIGLVTETINNNQEGFITTSGLVRNINTTGSLQGETWADGDILYLSPTTAGNVTKVKPTAPNHLVVIGYVVHAHANQGSIFVKVDNGYELDELHNVKITSAANNNVLAYTSATDIWENKTVETALGYTPENVSNKSTSTSLGTSDTLYPTQNAVKVYADTKFTLPSLTSGSVLFSNGTTIAQDNANFFWDDTNNRLGIGTNAPTSKLYIKQSGDGSSDGLIMVGLTNASTARLYVNGSGLWTFNRGGTDVMGINTTGNVLINTTTDAGFKLDVNGTARINTLTIGLGAGQVASNTVIGVSAGGSNTTGSANFFGGYNAGFNNLGGARNTAVGNLALYSNQTGNNNNAFGDYSFASLNTGSNNAAYGQFSGRWIANGSTPLTNTNNSVFIGVDSRANANSETNQIVIGYQAIGIGSNSVVLGNDSITKTALKGNVLINTTTDAGFKLDVNGNTRSSRFYAIDGITLTRVSFDGFNNQTGINFTSATSSIRYFLSGFDYLTAGFNLDTVISPVRNTIDNFGDVVINGGGSERARFKAIGNIGFGTASPNASALLDLTSTTRGFLPPRMTTTQKNAIATPAAGLVVYDTTLGKLCVRTAAAWETITSV